MKVTDDLDISEGIGVKGNGSSSFQHAEDVKEELHSGPKKASLIFENPLANVPRDKLIQDVEVFCAEFGLQEHLNTFIKGALISQNPSAALSLPELSEEDKYYIERETTHKWSQPWKLYFMAGSSQLLIQYLSPPAANTDPL